MRLRVAGCHLALAERLVERAPRNGELAPVNLERFWEDPEVALRDPFGSGIPYAECLFAEFGIPQDTWRSTHDVEWRFLLNRAYNDKAERVVGRRLLDDPRPDPSRPRYLSVKELRDLFEIENRWNSVSQSYWLHRSAPTPHELAALLDASRSAWRIFGRFFSFSSGRSSRSVS